MANVDQDARARVSATSGPRDPEVLHLFATDEANLTQLKVIVALYGFPSRAQVGGDGLFSAWLIVQHADAAPALQAMVLDFMQWSSSPGEIGSELIAMLTDRVLLAQGKPQRYGTQVHIQNGTETLLPTEDLSSLAERRKTMSLPPFVAYQCALKIMYSRS